MISHHNHLVEWHGKILFIHLHSTFLFLHIEYARLLALATIIGRHITIPHNVIIVDFMKIWY